MRTKRFRCNRCKYDPLSGSGRFRSADNDPKCPHCGETVRIVSAEKQRKQDVINEVKSGKQCRCIAYPFPHKTGVPRMCFNHPDVIFDIQPTEEEKDEYYKTLNTKRGRSCKKFREEIRPGDSIPGFE